MLQEESTDKAMTVNPTRPVKLGAAASPRGFGEEPETVRMPVAEPVAPMPRVEKRSTSKPSSPALPASGPSAMLDDFEGGDFIASVAPEPSFELGDMHLPDDSGILS